MSCQFPLCKRHAEKNGFCIHHRIYASEKMTEKKPVPVKKVSAKRKVVDKEYKKIVKDLLGKNKRCEVKSPVCTGIAQGLNHKQKRSPKNITKLDNLERACNACNLYIEQNPVWAKEHNHFISKYKKL